MILRTAGAPVDPVRDMDIIQLELILADVDAVERLLASKKIKVRIRRKLFSPYADIHNCHPSRPVSSISAQMAVSLIR